jgi:hypothetical protein
MRNRKPQRTKRNDTSEMRRRDHIVISSLQTGYSRATHSQIFNHEPSPEWHKTYHEPHPIWTCKETEAERNRINITSEVWKGGTKEIEKLITYVKKIQLYNGILKEK